MDISPPHWLVDLLPFRTNNATVSRMFSGSNGNEGLGLLSICFDWQLGFHTRYIFGVLNPVTIPLKSQLSMLIGTILCMVGFVSVYYNNIWESQNFPFLSRLLFYGNGSLV
ncbi:hypothetical protein EV363DRAFT_1438118 [Boletus edulis]|nr:hypothetical protein EV363DRAFT_1438118 [Boletus edulis]